MSDYQNWICDLFKELNSPPVYPTYPPYHKDLYLEQMFVNSKEKNKDRYLIPVFWTNVYKQNKEKLLQYKLSQLNPKEKYYCVCTHDDAPKENLPTDTLVYSAGGIKTNTIPIPLVVSRIPFFEQVPKDIYASFVGSYTHSIRAIMYQYKHDDFVINVLPQWKEKIEEQNQKAFHQISARSKYIFCPRGYGTTSYRLYEAFQYGAVPVYISDKFWLPWEDELKWDNLIIKITPEQIPNMRNILKTYDEKLNYMTSYAKEVYDEFFSIEGVYKKIIT